MDTISCFNVHIPPHTHWHTLMAASTVLYIYSWRWTRTVSEACRVLINHVKQAASRWLFTYTILPIYTVACDTFCSQYTTISTLHLPPDVEDTSIVQNVTYIHRSQAIVVFTGTCCVFWQYINLLQPTGYVMHHQFNILRSAHTVFMCFVFIWEQTATCATYSIKWLVFITEMKSVYSAVRTGALNKAVCASSVKG